MCQIFAGQDPHTYAYETRSVRLMGHATSVRLEARFWTILEEIVAEQHMTMAKFLSKLYEEALTTHGEVQNFASLLRCSCLIYLSRDFDRARLEREAKTAAPRVMVPLGIAGE